MTHHTCNPPTNSLRFPTPRTLQYKPALLLLTPLKVRIILTHPRLKVQEHIHPIAASILTLARTHLAKPRLLIVPHEAISTNQGYPLRDARVLDALDIALEQNLTEAFAREIRMHAQRVYADRVAVFVVAGRRGELIVGLPVFGEVHGGVGDDA
jgi:hypothetical protein